MAAQTAKKSEWVAGRVRERGRARQNKEGKTKRWKNKWRRLRLFSTSPSASLSGDKKKNKNFFITFPISALKRLRRDATLKTVRRREVEREREWEAESKEQHKYETSRGNNHNNNKNGRKSLKINQSAVAHTHTPRKVMAAAVEEVGWVGKGGGGRGLCVVHIIHSVISNNNNKNNKQQRRLQKKSWEPRGGAVGVRRVGLGAVATGVAGSMSSIRDSLCSHCRRRPDFSLSLHLSVCLSSSTNPSIRISRIFVSLSRFAPPFVLVPYCLVLHSFIVSFFPSFIHSFFLSAGVAFLFHFLFLFFRKIHSWKEKRVKCERNLYNFWCVSRRQPPSPPLTPSHFRAAFSPVLCTHAEAFRSYASAELHSVLNAA